LAPKYYKVVNNDIYARKTGDFKCLKRLKQGKGPYGHYAPQIMEVLQRYLGSDKKHNAYTAEITALELAAEITILSSPSYTKCVIYVDSQAAIKGINKPSKQSGQMILTSAIAKIQALADGRQMVIEIIWVPGHEGEVEGNEMADEAAKEAAKSEGNDATSRDPCTNPSNQ
jgi:ribonuclease HI